MRRRSWRTSTRRWSGTCGIVHLTKTLADQLGRHGITVNLVHPGPTRTERTDEETTRRASSNAIGRIVDAREIGLVVAFLASAKAAAVTGVAIDASGGSLPGMFQEPAEDARKSSVDYRTTYSV